MYDIPMAGIKSTALMQTCRHYRSRYKECINGVPSGTMCLTCSCYEPDRKEAYPRAQHKTD